METDACLLCSKSPVKRRPLHSVSNHHLIPILVELLKEIFNSSVDKTILPPDSWVCPACIRAVERVRKLREDLRKVEGQLRAQLKQAGESCRLQVSQSALLQDTTLSSTPTSSRKRSAPPTPTGSLSEKRRALAFGTSTPVRTTMDCMMASADSPAVAVSLFRKG